MKKLLATLVLSIASAAALAAGPVVGLQYDMDRANGNGFRSANEVKLSIAQDTVLGTFDAGLLGARYRGARTNDDANGFELGYSNGFALGQFGVKARAAYGRMNQIDPNGGGFTGNTGYWVAGVEGAMPVTQTLNSFVGYRHRNAFGSGMTAQNRYTIGVDYALTQTIALRAAYAHTRQGALIYNGLQTAVNYNF